MAVGLFCGVLWVCFVVVVPHFYLFILFVIGDFVWSGLRKKIGDLGLVGFGVWVAGFQGSRWRWWWWWVVSAWVRFVIYGSDL